MSRRERDARDSHGKRLHSRFDREPTPKKLKRDEKLDVNLAQSGHRNPSAIEFTSHEPKQKSMQDDAPLKAPPASSTPVMQIEKKNLERKDEKPTVRTQNSSDNREAPRSRSYYQHDDRGGAGQGGGSFARRETDHRKRDDSRDRSINRVRDVVNDQPKKNERSQSHADEKSGIWRHDRFHESESRAPTLKKRPAFREKKTPSEPQQTVTAPQESDKSDPAASKRGEERGGIHPQSPDKPERTFSRAADDRRDRREGFHHNRGEAQRNVVNPSRERYGAIRGRGDRFNVRQGARDSNRAGGFEVEKWKHDLFDEANRSPPPKKEEEQIAKVEALLAL